MNVIFLVCAILVVIASVLFIFFWNRLLGFLLGLAIRLLYWDESATGIWVDFGSVHFSILAGRILFKELRYSSSNQTVRIVKCQLSWRYWLRLTAEEEDFRGENPTETKDKTRHSAIPCRIHISVEGVEWFMYNRTPAYEDILSRMHASDHGASFDEVRTNSRNIEGLYYTEHDETPQYRPGEQEASVAMPVFLSESLSWLRRQLPYLDPKNLLPFSFDATKAAIICGNNSTENLLMAQFTTARGTYGIVQSRSKFDLYKQLLRVGFENVFMSCIDNQDYWNSVPSIGKDVQRHLEKMNPEKVEGSSHLSFRRFMKLWRRRRKFFHPTLANNKKDFHTAKSKKKASKSVEDESHIGADFSTLEYAIDRKLLETRLLEMTYYSDVPGVVPANAPKHEYSGLEDMDIGNGDLPPEWGVDLITHGGFVRYGPWADRQRARLQHAFFPPSFQHASPTVRLAPGDQRMCTFLKILWELRDGTTLHIPFREASKNWQWDGLAPNMTPPGKQREAASVQIRVGDNSTLKYLMPWVATESGYDASMTMSILNISMTSSLNDIVLLKAEAGSLSCHLPAPLVWNDPRLWSFTIGLRSPIWYILRDHINMLTDLGKDWSSGPPHDFHLFIPMIYNIKFDWVDYEVNLYGNDHNIIDRPLVREENVLFNYRGPRLRNDVTIPANNYRPLSNTVSFTVDGSELILSLTLPRWNTNALYSPRQVTQISRIPSIHVDASYDYFTEVRENNIDQLKLAITARDPVFKEFGWVVRHIMVLRENYFGAFTQFSTTEEYLFKREKQKQIGDPLEFKYRPGKSNSFQVEMTVHVVDGCIILPAGLPGYERAAPFGKDGTDNVGLGAGVLYKVPQLQLVLRLHDYYMEMSLNIDPIKAMVVTDCPDLSQAHHFDFSKYKESLVIEGVDITANRLFGPQPRTSTYLCMWEIHIGDVRSSVTVHDGRILLQAARSFLLCYNDPFNTPASDYAIVTDPDATFLRVSVDCIDCVLLASQTTLRLSLPDGFSLASNDLAGDYYRKVLVLLAPAVDVLVLLALPSGRRWIEAASLHFEISLDLYRSPSGWKRSAKRQKEFLQKQDSETQRAQQLTREPLRERVKITSMNSLHLPHAQLPIIASGSKRRKLSHPRYRHRGRVQHDHTWLSDSDAEPNISEVDRDFRLAKSRPSSPIVPSPDNHSMSSGDESDETDSNASQMSWSDVSDTEDVGGLNNPKHRISRYWNICRQYAFSPDSSPSSWHPHSVSLLQDFRPTSVLDVQESDSCRSVLFDTPMNQHGISEVVQDDNVGEAIFRLRTIKEIRIFVTPLVASAVPCVLDEFLGDMSSPEFQVDSLMVDAVNDASKQPSKTIFDIALPSVRVTFLQDAMSITEFQALQSSTVVSQPPRGEVRIASILDIRATGGRALFEVPSDIPSNSGKFEMYGVALTLGTLYCERGLKRTRMSLSPSPILRVDLGNTSGVLRRNKLDAKLGPCAVNFQARAIEVSISTAKVIDKCTKIVLRAARKASTRVRLRLQHLIHDLLASSREKSVVYTLSMIQPSFLVQAGRPKKLRESWDWKLLLHLRDSLRHKQEGERLALSERQRAADVEIALDDIDEVLGRASDNKFVEAETISSKDVSFLQFLFNKNSAALPTANTSSQFTAVSFRAGQVDLVYEDAEVEDRNRLTVGPAYARFHMSERTLLGTTVIATPILKFLRLDKFDSGSLLSLMATLHVENICLQIFPNFIPLLQHILHVHRMLFKKQKEGRQASGPKRFTERPIALEVGISVGSFRLQAAAANIVFELAISSFSSSTSSHICPSTTSSGVSSASTSQTFGFNVVSVKAKERLSPSNAKSSDVLAAFIISRGTASGKVYQQESRRNDVLRCHVHIQSIDFSVPRSALRLYHFIDQWRQDYLPGIDAMMQALFKEIRNANNDSQPVPPPTDSQLPSFHVQLSIASLVVSLQVMHGTWISWQAIDALLFGRNNAPGVRGGLYNFGMQFSKHGISLSSKTSSDTSSRPIFYNAVLPNTTISSSLPSFRLSGSYDGVEMNILTLVDFFKVKVKPKHLDTLLSVQQKFGQDFNDLLVLIGDTRSTRPVTNNPARSSPPRRSTQFIVAGRFKGFNIGLDGPSSTQYLECKDIDGTMTDRNGRRWQIDLSDLALLLTRRNSSTDSNEAFSRQRCAAFVTVDLKARNRSEVHESANPHFLELSVTKLHAVMQPSSIGEFGDFLDHLQTELLVRKEQRALELEEFKEKARIIMRTFDVNPRTTPAPATSSFLSNRTVKITMSNVGVAFPLSLDTAIQIPHASMRGSSPLRAFLFSIKSVSFEAHRGETGRAHMDGFSFQFVPRFRQSVPAEFSGDVHQTRNRLVYPHMTADVKSESTASSRRIEIASKINGFILDLDPSITGYVFGLIDVYRHGKNSMEKLATGLPRMTADSQATTPVNEPSAGTQFRTPPTPSIRASFKFLSGHVRMHSGSERLALSLPDTAPRSRHEFAVDQATDTFKLPELSVWCDFRATPTLQRSSSAKEVEASQLVFKSTIHSSHNTLKPSLLPFITEVVHNFEERMRKAPPNAAHHHPVITGADILDLPKTSGSPFDPSKTSLQISFSLRIDQSQLELTCQPDVNVIAGLHWDSGGFVVNISPGLQSVSITGAIGGLTTSLKHGFLSEACAQLDARNLNFSVGFSKATLASGQTVNNVSVIVDTEVAGTIRLSRLQDFLCFKAVWLDNIPILNAESIEAPSIPSRSTSVLSQDSNVAKQDLSTAIIVRARKINLEADLGQSISTVTLSLQSVVVRSRVTEDVTELSISMNQTDFTARGNLSGDLSMPDFLFQTVRRRDGNELVPDEHWKMLDLTITSGPLAMKLESDDQWLLQYRAEPLRVNVFDEWTLTNPTIPDQNRRLRLYFTVLGTKVVALMTAGTVPKLVVYAGKFAANLEAQKEGAIRDSKIFRSMQGAKPENALSQVATALFQSARSKFKEEESLSYAIGQHMSLRLEELLFVLFPRALDDRALARFVGRNVSARLERVVDIRGFPTVRDLHLSLSHMAIAQLVKYSFQHAPGGSNADVFQWTQPVLRGVQENVIFSLPSMDMQMVAHEQNDSDKKVLLYDFNSTFVRREEQKELDNINITFNLGLYSWLTGLHKTFSNELKRAQDVAEWRPTPLASISTALRARSVEAISTPEKEEILTESHLLSKHLSLPGISAGSVIPQPTPLAADPLRPPKRSSEITYVARTRHIERLTVRQLGEATPDVMHPFFTKKAGFNLETALPQYVHEYATLPVEEIMKVLVKIYSKQLRAVNEGNGSS
ncbi:hypothetical protein BD410DRAFT_116796 [Rickenella mellea]|uniref:Csf1 N-terminal domain-containing protein n=1 Tax=Rickenella mellea TaxID=50990 RepID=A0A4Y7QB46_9AGAM|nr:hypothetical protein BD410DRAFT_116796 [Rickenella mellea]